MTNNQNSWREEFHKICPIDPSPKCRRGNSHPCTGSHSEPYLNEEERERSNHAAIKAFISKVESAAYSRGKAEMAAEAIDYVETYLAPSEKPMFKADKAFINLLKDRLLQPKPKEE